MSVTLQRWGNSQGIRIPKSILNELGLKENDNFEITTSNNSIILTKSKKRHRTLQERVEAFYGKPINEIQIEQEDEIITSAVGEEVW